MKRLDQIRRGLRLLLGGRCRKCDRRNHLEVHHVHGCTWVQRHLNSRNRWERYLAEFKTGVHLELLCRRCNAALNQHTYGVRS